MPVSERREITPFEQHAQELASESLETHRIPDPYVYINRNGELFSPTAHRRIKNTIEDRTSHLGWLEYQAVLATEKWAAENDSGVSVWISPPFSGVYPVLKIIVSEIEYENGIKRLFNRAILFDVDEKEGMKFAWNLTSFSENKPVFTNLDQVRSTPLILDTKDKSWIEILEGLIPDPKLWDSIRQKEDIRAKNKALERARSIQKRLFFAGKPTDYQEAQMEAKQMIGPHLGSCPPRTALQVFSEGAETYVGSSLRKDPDFCENCPVCGAEIRCIVRNGQYCPNCKTVKRCG